LPEVNTTASHSGWQAMENGSAPKADTESRMRRRPAARTAAQIASGSLTTPLPVSLWTTSTCPMAASRSSAAAISAAVTGPVSGPGSAATSRPASRASRAARWP
jgi:hypothetical protein